VIELVITLSKSGAPAAGTSVEPTTIGYPFIEV